MNYLLGDIKFLKCSFYINEANTQVMMHLKLKKKNKQQTKTKKNKKKQKKHPPHTETPHNCMISIITLSNV